MRVLHVLHTSLPFICGYSIRSDYILRFQQQLGLTPAVVTSAQHPNGESLQEEIQGILYWRTPAYAGLQKPLARELGLMRLLKKRLQAAVREFEPDLIHAHSPMLAGLPALAVARAAGRPFVYEVRDLWENASVDRGKFGVNSPVYRLARRMETRVLRRADAVVTICHCLREELAPRVGRTDRLIVVDNGVDVSGFTPDVGREEQRRRWRLEGKRIIGYVGTFQPYEGLDMLISALPQILKQEPQAHLVITGSGGQERAAPAGVRRRPGRARDLHRAPATRSGGRHLCAGRFHGLSAHPHAHHCPDHAPEAPGGHGDAQGGHGQRREGHAGTGPPRRDGPDVSRRRCRRSRRAMRRAPSGAGPAGAVRLSRPRLGAAGAAMAGAGRPLSGDL